MFQSLPEDAWYLQRHLSDRVPRGIIWMPFRFAEASANKLTNSAFDNVTKTGECKVAAARIEAVK